MSRRSTWRGPGVWIVVLTSVATVALIGRCEASREEPRSAPASKRALDQTLTPPGTLTPGISKIEYGRVQAAGTVRHIDLEGGFWALTKPAGPLSSQAEDVVVVVVNAEEVGLPRLEGQDVAVNGRLIDGVSIRMAGPEMTAEEVIRPH